MQIEVIELVDKIFQLIDKLKYIIDNSPVDIKITK